MPVKLFDKNRCYIELTDKSWSWVTLANINTFDFTKFPTLNASNFLLLFDFRGGADGRVWLACSTTGRVCVIKFYNGNWGEKDIQRESDIWNGLWKFPTRLIMLCSKPALLMPFVVCLSEEKVLASKSHKDAVVDAVATMAKNHYFHPDLKWMHVGFYKIQEGKIESLKAIFIDLIRVKQDKMMNIEKCGREMLAQLGLPPDILKSQLQSSQTVSQSPKKNKSKK